MEAHMATCRGMEASREPIAACYHRSQLCALSGRRRLSGWPLMPASLPRLSCCLVCCTS